LVSVPGWIGPWEIAILLIVALLVFGPKRLPEMGRSLGKGMRDFKKAVSSDDDDSVKKALSFDEDDEEPVVHASTVTDAKTPREHDPVS
jgi:sec-independent protein translocase protein TatA